MNTATQNAPSNLANTPQSKAEELLQSGASNGSVTLGAVLPEAATEDCRIRASFLRDLLLRDPGIVDLRGLELCGAWIEGPFDLCGLHIKHRLRFGNCRFVDHLGLIDAHIPTLHMPGCRIAGIDGANARFDGGLILNSGFIAESGIDLRGARIPGNLDLDSAKLWWQLDAGRGPICLDLERANIGGALTLRIDFEAHGDIRLYSAKIGTNLEILGASLGALAEEGKRAPDADDDDPLDRTRSALDLEKATVGGTLLIVGPVQIYGAMRLFGATLGQLEMRGKVTISVPDADAADWAPALNADFCQVKGIIDIREEVFLRGDVTFFHAAAGMLEISPVALPEGRLTLDGLEYERLGARNRSEDLIDILDRQNPYHLHPFRPQPWFQCAAVLDSMGYDDEATRIRIEMERRHRESIRRGLTFPWSTLTAAGDWLLDQTVRFGYRPMRAGIWALLFLLAGWAVAVWFEGSFVPTKSPPPVFHALAYATDSFVPVLKLGMADAYRPADGAKALRLGVWLYQILGWVLAGFWVAGLSGITKK